VEIQKRMFVVHSANPSENWSGVTREFQYPLLCGPRGVQENPVKLNQEAFVLLPVGKPRDSYYTTYFVLVQIYSCKTAEHNNSYLNVIDIPRATVHASLNFDKRGIFSKMHDIPVLISCAVLMYKDNLNIK